MQVVLALSSSKMLLIGLYSTFVLCVAGIKPNDLAAGSSICAQFISHRLRP